MPTLDGNKTYIVAAIYIAAVIASHYFPGVDWETIKGVIAGFGLITLRQGVAKIQQTQEGKTNNA